MKDSRPAFSDSQTSEKIEHASRVQLRWFSFVGILEIRLRWIAAAGVLIGTWILDTVVDRPTPTWPLYTIGLCMLVYNFILRRYLEQRFEYPARMPGYDYQDPLQFYWRELERDGSVEVASSSRSF